MTTNFDVAIRPVLVSIKFVGIINISFTMQEQTRLLIWDPNTKFYTLLELTRILILFILTHLYLTSSFQTILGRFYLITFWKIVIEGRLSEMSIIKYVLNR